MAPVNVIVLPFGLIVLFAVNVIGLLVEKLAFACNVPPLNVSADELVFAPKALSLGTASIGSVASVDRL